MDFGTIGCVGLRGGRTVVVSCDHVLVAGPFVARSRIQLFEELSFSPQDPIAQYLGCTLVDEAASVADLACAPILVQPPGDPGRLPNRLPSSGRIRIQGLGEPREGLGVFLWGAVTRRYITGTVVEPASRETLPHPRWGLRAFELQFSIQVSPARAPQIGDSGGPILTRSGFLVGFLQAGQSVCRIDAAGNCISYGVPAAEGLRRLGVRILLGPEEYLV